MCWYLWDCVDLALIGRCWDLAMGRCVQTLTNHKKAIRSMVLHHDEYTFASGAADNVKVRPINNSGVEVSGRPVHEEYIRSSGHHQLHESQ
jgi:hypothetical protein